MVTALSTSTSSFEHMQWAMPIKGGPTRHVVSIETVDGIHLPEIEKVLQMWKEAYKKLWPGYGVERILRCSLRSLSTGRVVVAKDSNREVQAFARVVFAKKEGDLHIEELVVAPWNKKSAESSGKGSTFPQYNPGTGTVMMYALCQLTIALKGRVLRLTSSSEAHDFYAYLGMWEIEYNSFALPLSKGIPPMLLGRVQKYFPEEVAARAADLALKTFAA